MIDADKEQVLLAGIMTVLNNQTEDALCHKDTSEQFALRARQRAVKIRNLFPEEQKQFVIFEFPPVPLEMGQTLRIYRSEQGGLVDKHLLSYEVTELRGGGIAAKISIVPIELAGEKK